MEKKMRKILNPNLLSKKEQLEVRRAVKAALERYPYHEAKKAVLAEREHQKR